MPYNLDRSRLEAMLPYLAPLAQGVAYARWEVTRGSPNTVAYRIREALHIARLHPSDYPDLAKHALDYSVSVVDGNFVQAKRRGPVLSPPTSSSAATPTQAAVVNPVSVVDLSLLKKPPATMSAPFQGAPSSSGFSTDGPQTPESIITAWEKGGALKRTLYFPEPRLSPRQLTELWLWAGNSNPRVMLMVAEGDGALTVAQYDPQVVEFSWHPPQELVDEMNGEGA